MSPPHRVPTHLTYLTHSTHSTHPAQRSPVYTRAELVAAPLHDAARREVVRADRFVDGQDRGEVRDVEDLDERLEAGVAGAERARDARVDRLHVPVVLARRIDHGHRQVA